MTFYYMERAHLADNGGKKFKNRTIARLFQIDVKCQWPESLSQDGVFGWPKVITWIHPNSSNSFDRDVNSNWMVCLPLVLWKRTRFLDHSFWRTKSQGSSLTQPTPERHVDDFDWKSQSGQGKSYGITWKMFQSQTGWSVTCKPKPPTRGDGWSNS